MKENYNSEIVSITNSELQELINDLNSMFLNNWTPLFKEDKPYENWSEKRKIIYIYLSGEISSEVILLKIKNTSINNILSGQNITSEQISITLEEAYNKIIAYLIKVKFTIYFQERFRDCYQERFKDNYLEKSFESNVDFIFVLRFIKHVFRKDYLIKKGNSIKFKDETICIPNLEKMIQCYGIMRDLKIKKFTKKDIKDSSIEVFELLKAHFKIKSQLVNTINNLLDVYFESSKNLSFHQKKNL